ncbi:MAG: ABC transporter ATP-binding protein [Polyangiales bacterium]
MAEVIAVESLTKRFGNTTALRSISFALQGPQVVGILGPNGAGKTTLLEILEGLSTPTEGQVRLFGQALSLRDYPRRRIGVVMQREFALDRITVSEYAALFASIYGVREGGARILSRAGLNERAHVALEKLSGGEAQRLFLAAAVVHDPELVFLDEPTAQLDPASKARIGEDIRTLAELSTVVITTHDLREADAVCDHVLFLVDGEVKANGARQELIDAAAGKTIEDAFFHYCGEGAIAALPRTR